jgi:thioredoxin 1
MALINITGDDFEKEVLSAKEPVLVFFWAAWSGPSKMVRPLLEE